jgi:hypothetical protein
MNGTRSKRVDIRPITKTTNKSALLAVLKGGIWYQKV